MLASSTSNCLITPSADIRSILNLFNSSLEISPFESADFSKEAYFSSSDKFNFPKSNPVPSYFADLIFSNRTEYLVSRFIDWEMSFELIVWTTEACAELEPVPCIRLVAFFNMSTSSLAFPKSNLIFIGFISFSRFEIPLISSL